MTPAENRRRLAQLRATPTPLNGWHLLNAKKKTKEHKAAA